MYLFNLLGVIGLQEGPKNTQKSYLRLMWAFLFGIDGGTNERYDVRSGVGTPFFGLGCKKARSTM